MSLIPHLDWTGERVLYLGQRQPLLLALCVAPLVRDRLELDALFARLLLACLALLVCAAGDRMADQKTIRQTYSKREVERERTKQQNKIVR